MKIAMATRNPTKIAAVQTVFQRAYPGEAIIIEQTDPPEGEPEQPLNREIVAGALARAEAARGACEADYYVGVEAGLMQLPGCSRWLSIQACAIVDAQGGSPSDWGLAMSCPRRLKQPFCPACRCATRLSSTLA